MTNKTQIAAEARALPQVYAYIESRCAHLGLARGLQLRLELMAEELFLNAVLHGHSPTPVELELAEAGTEVELRLSDGGKAFDPFSAARPAPAVADPSARPVGGLGLTLTTAMSARRSYQRIGGRNRICIALPRQ